MKLAALNTRLSPIAIAVCLSACSSVPEKPASPTPVAPAATTQIAPPTIKGTLASLDRTTINIPKIDDQLESKALQKIDLPGAGQPLQPPPPARDLAPVPVTRDEVIDAKLNEGIYNQLLEQARKAPDPGTANAYLQVARKLKLGNSKFAAEKEEASLLEDNVTFYKELLKRMPAPEARAQIYYDLAKTYDLLGKKEESVAALKTLVTDYPKSPLLTEVYFRLAEDSFTHNRFTEAAGYYQKVLGDRKSEFYDTAVYKRGWSLYRAGDFETALPLFFDFAERIMVKPQKTDKEEAKLHDAMDVISLSFMMQDGPKTLDAHFDKVGPKFYESAIYANLAEAYLGKRQFTNAARTYESFIARHPADPSTPELSSAIIKIYEQGGFPSQVVLAKEDFITRYNPESEYWKNADEPTRAKLRPILEQHIVDLAKHYHALAQLDNNEGYYLKAAQWYRAHLELNPPESEAIGINELLAEALYSAKHYEDAIKEFEKTAYEYNNPKAVDAAYFALQSYQEWDKSLGENEEARKALLPKRGASVFKYASKFPQDENTPKLIQGLTQFLYDHYKEYDDSSRQLVKDLQASVFTLAAAYPENKNSALMLQGLTNLYLHFKDYDGAIGSAKTLLAINPPVDNALRQEAAGVIADAQYDQGKFNEADKSYQAVLAYNVTDAKLKAKYQDRLATSYYRQAEQLRDDKKPEEAAAFFQKAAQASVDVKIRASSDFDAAAVLLNGEKYKEAIPVLISFRDHYPNHELTQTIPEKLALAYEKLGDTENAAAQYEAIAARDVKKNPQNAREALWAAAEMYEKVKKTDAALRIYRQYSMDATNPPDLRAEATFKLYNNAVANQQPLEQQTALKTLAQLFEKQGNNASPRMKYFGALSNFKLSQPLYDAFAAIPLKQPLKTSILAKKKAMQNALSAYNKVAAIGVAEFVTAANFQQGEIYRQMAKDLLQSERPKGLSDLEAEQYTILLEEQADPLSDKAIDLHSLNSNLVKQDVYDSFVQKSFDALSELSPGRYNKHEQLEEGIDDIY